MPGRHRPNGCLVRFHPGFELADTTVTAAAVSLYGYYKMLTDPSLSSPCEHVRVDAPPFFIAHGDRDTLVLIEAFAGWGRTNARHGSVIAGMTRRGARHGASAPAYTCCSRMMNFFLKASANEVVPMLRRMEAEVAEGKTVQEAYAAALHETKMLKLLVGEPAPGLPFGTALLEGATKSRIRPLAELAGYLRPERGMSRLPPRVRRGVEGRLHRRRRGRCAGDAAPLPPLARHAEAQVEQPRGVVVGTSASQHDGDQGAAVPRR